MQPPRYRPPWLRSVAVIGLGKIGLPLAVQVATTGLEVRGVDRNADLVQKVNAGREPFPGEEHLATRLADVIKKGALRATTDLAAAVSDCSVVLVVVPLGVTDSHEPQFDGIDNVTQQVGAALKPGTLVIFETTLPVGTTRERLRPTLEQYSGLVEGRDFYVVFSPERVLSGRIFRDLRHYPKLIGGLSESGAKRAKEFYESVIDFDERDGLPQANGVWNLGSADTAELAKLAETTYRDVNIGLANQLACFASDNNIDFDTVIEACNSQPYSHLHRPGIAVGGHCIPVYPWLYLNRDPSATIVRAAREANLEMPRYMIGLAQLASGSLRGKNAVVLGVSYRGGVKETALSGAFAVVEQLALAGAVVAVHDPLFSALELDGLGLRPYSIGDGADIVILQADHSEYRTWGHHELPGAKVVVDGRGILDQGRFGDATFIAVGKPWSRPISDSAEGRLP